MSDGTTNVVMVLNDAPYGSERTDNALRLALELANRETFRVRIFLLGDAAACAVAGRETPQGFSDVERMLRGVLRRLERWRPEAAVSTPGASGVWS